MEKKYLSLLMAVLIMAAPMQAMQRRNPEDSCCTRVKKALCLGIGLGLFGYAFMGNQNAQKSAYISLPEDWTAQQGLTTIQVDYASAAGSKGNSQTLGEILQKKYPECPANCLAISDLAFSLTALDFSDALTEQEKNELDAFCSPLSSGGAKRKICPVTHKQAKENSAKKNN